MPFSEEKRHQLLEETREAAQAALEDLTYLREMTGRSTPDSAAVRRSSSILRRLLVERDLERVSSPRIGSPSIIARNIESIVRIAEQNKVFIVSTADIKFAGHSFGSIVVGPYPGDPNRPLLDDGSISLSLSSFMRQEAICFRGSWISRREVLKYVANVASGVHTGSTKTDVEQAIRDLRYAVTVTASEGDERAPSIGFGDFATHFAEDRPFQTIPGRLDLALLELVATAIYVTRSPDIHALEAVIAAE